MRASTAFSSSSALSIFRRVVSSMGASLGSPVGRARQSAQAPHSAACPPPHCYSARCGSRLHEDLPVPVVLVEVGVLQQAPSLEQPQDPVADHLDEPLDVLGRQPADRMEHGFAG